MALDITINELTDGVIEQTDDGSYVWTGSGIFDKLIAAVNNNVKIEYDNGRITGTAYANVYLGGLQSVIQQSVAYVLQEHQVEAQVDLLRQQLATETNRTTSVQLDNDTKSYTLANILPLQKDQVEAQVASINKDIELKTAQISDVEANTTFTESKTTGQNYQNDYLLPLQKDKSTEDLQLALDTHGSNVAKASKQVDKLTADINLVNVQADGIAQQVIDNRKIKALNSLSDTYGTFGAGGLTLSSDMWTVYFSLVNDLTAVAAPASTTVTKVS